jgi:signal transduction histidine kinase/ActR/RegA family two-component response regulator
MRERIRTFDWSMTPLGPIASWPESLQLALRMMLTARHPLMLSWKPEFILFYNDRARAILGEHHPAALGQPFKEVLPEAWESVRHQAESMLRSGPATENAGFRFSIDAEPDDTTHAFACSPIPDDYGGVGGMLCIFAGQAVRPRGEPLRVSDRLTERAGQSLRDSEARFRAFTRATTDVIYRMSPDWSEVWYVDGRNFVADTHEPDANWLTTYIHPHDRPRVLAASERAVRTRSLFEMEQRVIRVDGTPGWAYTRAVPIFDAQGEVVEWFGASTDITQRKQAEEALRTSENRYRTLFNSIDEGYCIIRILFDPAGHAHDYVFEEVNASFERYTGIRNPEGRSMREIAPGHESHWYARYGRIVLTGIPERFVSQASAFERWFDVYAFRIGEPEEHRLAVLFKDITESRQTEAALRDSEERLRKTADDLARADRRKDEFLAMLAHELRGPLAPLSNMLQLLKRNEGDRDMLRLAGQTMERQLRQLVRLVDDLLDVNRINRNRLELRKERVELAAILSQAVEGCRPLADGFQHQLDITLPDEPIYLDADPVRLVQVFSNLVNNACKYTEQSGRIAVTAERQGDTVVVKVVDTGQGIPADKLGGIFELFVQVERSLDRAQGGLGIGLALVRQLVEMHHGTVEAYSGGPGQGSEFVVRLPALPETTRTEIANATGTAASTAPLPPVVEVQPTRLYRILVVDDNHDAADSLGMLLRGSGHDVRTAYDGKTALAAAGEFRPEAILLDLGLPGLSGFEVARRIRKESWGEEIRLIALSGWGQEDDIRRTREAGFNAHMIKPPDYPALLALLAALTSKTRRDLTLR